MVLGAVAEDGVKVNGEVGAIRDSVFGTILEGVTVCNGKMCPLACSCYNSGLCTCP